MIKKLHEYEMAFAIKIHIHKLKNNNIIKRLCFLMMIFIFIFYLIVCINNIKHNNHELFTETINLSSSLSSIQLPSYLSYAFVFPFLLYKELDFYKRTP